MRKRYEAFGNAVRLAVTDHLVAEGYTNEEQALVCVCCGLPGQTAEEAAAEIAKLLNMADYWPVKNLGEERHDIEH